MPVDTRHASFNRHAAAIARIRDCLAGPDAVALAGETYLPKLTDQEPADYKSYRTRALFYGATERTHDALVGFIFRKPAEVTLPADIDAFADDIDLCENDFAAYARTVVADVCSVGNCATIVDFSEVESRPFFAFYPRESVINWRYERHGGKQILVLLVLEECAEIAGSDPFVPDTITRWRVFTVVDAGKPTQRVQVAVHERATNSDTGGAAQTSANVTQPPKVMVRRGKALKEIPAVFHTADGEARAGVGSPPLAAISAVNVSHYRTSADLENGRHIAGLPTPVISGVERDKTSLALGCSYAWVLPPPEAKAYFLEFDGQGLAALEKAMTEKEGQMAALGARLIEPRQKDAEAFETVALRATAETSTLAEIAGRCSKSLTYALAWAAWWLSTGADDQPSDHLETVGFALNTDFGTSQMAPQMLTAVVGAWQQNALSREALHFCLARGEMLPDGRTMEEELDAIAENPPMPAPVALDPNKVPPEDKGKPPAKPAK